MTTAPRLQIETDDLDTLLNEIRACRRCVETPIGAPLPHAPRPVIKAATSARIGIFGQAPGTRVHQSGVPFLDPSGDRLRDWMAVTPAEFYDESRVAIVPMGFCFPGLDAKGSDLPPRRECAPAWRAQVMTALPHLAVVLLIGQYAQAWHLSAKASPGAPARHRAGVTETVAGWRGFLEAAGEGRPRCYPLPHPSWRNNAWLRANVWFEAELLPVMRADIRRVLA